jgi:hypothetical protein
VRIRLIVVGLAVTVGVPALGYAQATDPQPQNPVAGAAATTDQAPLPLSPVINPQGADSQTRSQMEMYEIVLKSAITRAGQRLAAVVQQMSPVMLTSASEPAANFVLVPGSGPVFTLQVPQILNTSLRLFQMYAAQNSAMRAAPAGDASKVSANRVVAPDPIGPPTIPANFDPDETYTTFVKDEIVTAMLDHSSALNIKPGEYLTIAASSIDFASGNALYPASSSRMSFQIKGDDLAAFHQGHITRVEAVSKITQTKF